VLEWYQLTETDTSKEIEMDNYGMQAQAQSQQFDPEAVELVDRLYHDGFCFDDIVEVFVQDLEMEDEAANDLVQRIMNASS